MIAIQAEFLVTYGCTAALTRCRDNMDLSPHHGESVVIRSPRGLELGEVLCAVDSLPSAWPITAGELLRRATAEDKSQSHDFRRCGQTLLSDAQQLIEEMELPLVPLDADILLDGEKAFLHVLRWDRCTVTPFLNELCKRHRLLITLQDESRPGTEQEQGCSSCGSSGGCGSCGEEGCGSGGGCASGNCSRGRIDNPEELTRYFAGLREQLLARERMPLL